MREIGVDAQVRRTMSCCRPEALRYAPSPKDDASRPCAHGPPRVYSGLGPLLLPSLSRCQSTRRSSPGRSPWSLCCATSKAPPLGSTRQDQARKRSWAVAVIESSILTVMRGTSCNVSPSRSATCGRTAGASTMRAPMWVFPPYSHTRKILLCHPVMPNAWKMRLGLPKCGRVSPGPSEVRESSFVSALLPGGYIVMRTRFHGVPGVVLSTCVSGMTYHGMFASLTVWNGGHRRARPPVNV